MKAENLHLARQIRDRIQRLVDKTSRVSAVVEQLKKCRHAFRVALKGNDQTLARKVQEDFQKLLVEFEAFGGDLDDGK